MSGSLTTVVASTAIELVCRLYVGTHVSRGDFEQLPEHVEEFFSDEAAGALLLRYFGADFSLGMSLCSLAVLRDWKTAAELAAGVEKLAPAELVAALLASTTLEEADRRLSREQVDAALSDPAARAQAARKIARRNSYVRADVEYALDDPTRVHTELTDLLSRAAAALSETEVHGTLVARAGETTSLIESSGRERALLGITGGWTIRDAAQRLVLVPTQALGPLVITRLLPDDSILVCFGPPRDRSAQLTADDIAVVARALGSEQRIAILQHIAREPSSGQTLAKSLGLTQATVHYHTAMLRSSGLVTSTRDAHSVLHALDRTQIARALEGMSHLLLDDPEPPSRSEAAIAL